jgi:hypothetical protein
MPDDHFFGVSSTGVRREIELLMEYFIKYIVLCSRTANSIAPLLVSSILPVISMLSHWNGQSIKMDIGST